MARQFQRTAAALLVRSYAPALCKSPPTGDGSGSAGLVALWRRWDRWAERPLLFPPRLMPPRCLTLWYEAVPPQRSWKKKFFSFALRCVAGQNPLLGRCVTWSYITASHRDSPACRCVTSHSVKSLALLCYVTFKFCRPSVTLRNSMSFPNLGSIKLIPIWSFIVLWNIVLRYIELKVRR